MPDRNHGWKAAAAAVAAAVGLGTAVQQADRAGKAERRAAQEAERAAQEAQRANNVTAENAELRASVGVTLESLKSGQTLILTGVKTGNYKFNKLSNIKIIGKSGATVVSKSKSGYTFYFQGCTNVSVTGVKLKGGMHGCFINGGRSYTFESVDFSNNYKTGFLTNFADTVKLTNCISSNNKPEHGFYISDGTKNVWLTNCTASGNGRMGCQSNGTDSGTVYNVNLTNCSFSGNGYKASCSVYGTSGWTATNCRFGDAVGIVTAKKCPSNVVVSRSTFTGKKVEGRDGCQPATVKP